VIPLCSPCYRLAADPAYIALPMEIRQRATKERSPINNFAVLIKQCENSEQRRPDISSLYSYSTLS
jgi:hypothetical protein